MRKKFTHGKRVMALFLVMCMILGNMNSLIAYADYSDVSYDTEEIALMESDAAAEDTAVPAMSEDEAPVAETEAVVETQAPVVEVETEAVVPEESSETVAPAPSVETEDEKVNPVIVETTVDETEVEETETDEIEVAADGDVTVEDWFWNEKYVKVWNDNTGSTAQDITNAADRPADGGLGVHFYYSIDGAAKVELTAETAKNIGLSSADPTPYYGSSRWTYTFNQLPKKIKVAHVAAGKTTYTTHQVTYSWSEDAVEGYLPVEYSTDGKTMTNTVKQIWDAQLNFYDNSNVHGSRPTVTPALFDVYRYVSGQSKSTAVKLDLSDPAVRESVKITPVEGDPNSYKVEIENAAGYDAAGKPYIYYVKLKEHDDERNEDIISSTDKVGLGTYYTEYINVDNFTTQETELYYHGDLDAKIVNTTTFAVNKIWEDGDADPADRPNCTLYLYRIIEDNAGLVSEDMIESASPVKGNDSEPVPTSAPEGELIKIIFDGETVLPMYDNTGHKYVYFALETGNLGEYTAVITNDSSDELQAVKDIFQNVKTGAGFVKYVLNNGTIKNDREAEMTIGASKEFIAASMQSMTSGEVAFRLQRKVEGGSWEWATSSAVNDLGPAQNAVPAGLNYEAVDPIILTIGGFSSEAMVQSASGVKVDKYVKETGARVTYRWVEVGMAVNGGEWRTVATDGDPLGSTISYQEVNAGEYAPGVGPGSYTTARFIPENADADMITNRLVGETQVKIVKKWHDANGNDISLDPSLKDVKVTFQLMRNDGVGTEAGTLIDSNGNQVQPLVLTQDMFQNAEGGWTGYWYDLVRYDSLGREYKYVISEGDIDGSSIAWVSENEILNVIVPDDDSEDISVVESQTVFINTSGPGNELIFDLEKQWLDDSDLYSRRPVVMTIYRIADGKPIATKVLNESNGWKGRVKIHLPEGSTEKVDNYIALETTVGGVPVSYNTANLQAAKVAIRQISGAGFNYDPSARLGEIYADNGHALDFLYNVYIQEDEIDEARKHVHTLATNQRIGDLNLELTKTWSTGTDCLDATFELYKNGVKVNLKNIEGVTVSGEFAVVNADGSFTLKGNGAYKSVALIENLPKYDNMGVQFEYTVKELYVTDGTEQFRFNEGRVNVHGNEYVSTVKLNDIDIKGKEEHHSGDLYKWVGENKHQDTYTLEAIKVWHDDGANDKDGESTRPDVHFDLYRISVKDHPELQALVEAQDSTGLAAALASAPGTKLSGDQFWNTKHNEWYWSVNIGEVDRYDGEGYPYIYYIKEKYTSNNNYYHEAYSNLIAGSANFRPLDAPSPRPGETAFDTEDVYKLIESDLEKTVCILSDGVNKPANGGYGDFYSTVTVNWRETDRTISGRKLWQIPAGLKIADKELPVVTLEVFRSEKKLSETGTVTQDQIRSQLASAIKVNEITLNAARDGKYTYSIETDSDGNPLPKYDKYGRKYYYYVVEKESEAYKDAEISVNVNDFTVSNKFEPKDPSVEVPVKKVWASTVTLADGTTIVAPKAPVKFVLYADVVDEDGDVLASAEMGSVVLNPASATKVGSNWVLEGKITAGTDGKPLPYYGPNNIPLKYYVKEASLTKGTKLTDSENLTIGDVKIYLTLRANAEGTVYTAAEASANNEYWGDKKDFTAQKNWYNDNSDLVDNSAYRLPLILTISRSWSAQTVHGVNVPAGNEEYTTREVNAAGNWKVTLNDLPKYAPNGSAYTYYVSSETYKESGDSHKYTSWTPARDGNNYKNTFKTVNIGFTKTWKNSANNANLTADQIDMLKALGVIPTHVTVVLQRKIASDAAWSTIPVKSGVTANNTTTITYGGKVVLGKSYDVTKDTFNASQNWNAAHLPKYDINGNEYSYRIIEELTWPDNSVSTIDAVGNKDINYSGSKFNGENASLAISNGTYNFTNSVKMINLQVKKNWDDFGNRDDTRPDSFKVTVKTKSPLPAKSYELTMSKSSQVKNLWTNNSLYLPMPNTNLRASDLYEVEETVPVAKGEGWTYTWTNEGEAIKQVPDSNTTSPATQDLDNKGRGERKLKDVEATKVFAGDKALQFNDSTGTPVDIATITRPTIKFVLYYKWNGSWKEYTVANATADLQEDPTIDTSAANVNVPVADPQIITIGADNKGKAT